MPKFIFCTGDVDPIPFAEDDRRFQVVYVEAQAEPCCGQFDTCAKQCLIERHDEQRDADMGHNGYHQLADVLRRAYRQAATGKGAERHAQGQPFEAQPMQHLIGLYGVGFATGQAAKKAQESHRLPRERAVAELLGAINYLAGAVVAIEAGKTHHTD
jgi:hypothetical protein